MYTLTEISSAYCSDFRQAAPLKPDNTPMQGLYVVGTDNGSMYYSPYYDVPGFCCGLCIDSGYIAATEAVEYIK